MAPGSREAPEITAAARELAEAYRARYPDIDVMLTGTVVFAQATDEATAQTMSVTLPLAILAMVLCLLLILRSAMFIFVVLVAISLSIAIALGISVWLDIEFSPVVGMAPAMILTLAVADCVHLLTTYRQERLRGIDKKLAMVESLRINFQPVWLTSITTAIGFGILNFSESQPFQALGNVVLIGVMVAFLFSVVFLPAMVMLVPHRISPVRQVSYDPWMVRLANLVIRRHRALLVGTGVLVVGLVACLPMNQVNDVFNEYFDESFEVRRVNDFIMRELTGMHRIDYAVDAGSDSGTMEPAYLEQLDAFVSWLESQPEVTYVSAYTDVIKRLNRDMHGGDPDWYRIPEERELISQYTLLYELSLPQGLGLENQLDMSRRYSRVVVMLENIGSHPVLDFNDRAEQWLAENTQASMHARGTGMDILFGRITFRNIESMLTGAAIGLVSVSLLLILALRSWWYGFLSLLPNLLPALMSFGLWGVINGEIGLAVSVVACMTLGIVVDDTVHFLSKYVRARRELGLGVDDAVRYAFRTVGVALTATTVVLVANFLVIGTSHFYPNASMGSLAAITLAVALLVDFFFFVPLLVWLDRRRAGSGATEAVVK
jgi:predicted RND superfamily exporter protein